MSRSRNQQVEAAIKIAGSQQALATRCGVRYQAVQKWLRGIVPAERVLAIEEATHGKVSRHDLRPDIYPRESPRSELRA